MVNICICILPTLSDEKTFKNKGFTHWLQKEWKEVITPLFSQSDGIVHKGDAQ